MQGWRTLPAMKPSGTSLRSQAKEHTKIQTKVQTVLAGIAVLTKMTTNSGTDKPSIQNFFNFGSGHFT
eukprot:5699928-Amphidinium_carterae.1